MDVVLAPDFSPRVRENETFYVSEIYAEGSIPSDTVPAGASLERIMWRPDGVGSAAAASPGTAAPLERVDGATCTPGNHLLTVQAPDRAGGGDITLQFACGRIPCSWFAGPDPDRWPASSDGDGRAVDVLDWATFATAPPWPPDGRPYLGPDSLAYIPSKRRPPSDDFERRTFYEIRGDRIYARSEGDTVQQNAWIVVVLGGYDRDSPYEPIVAAGDPGLPPGFVPGSSEFPVLQSLGLMGAPSAFRVQLQTKLDDGTTLRSSFSSAFPNFDPQSALRNPQVAGYVRPGYVGRACVVSVAQDAEGLRELAAHDPFSLVALVDAGGGTPQERQLRRHVLTFHVAPAPSSGRMAAQAWPPRRR